MHSSKRPGLCFIFVYFKVKFSLSSLKQDTFSPTGAQENDFIVIFMTLNISGSFKSCVDLKVLTRTYRVPPKLLEQAGTWKHPRTSSSFWRKRSCFSCPSRNVTSELKVKCLCCSSRQNDVRSLIMFVLHSRSSPACDKQSSLEFVIYRALEENEAFCGKSVFFSD